MNARLLITALLGVAIGAAAASMNPLHSAPVPEPKAQRWEYKVVLVRAKAREGNPGDALTDQFNALAKVGWEYTGPVVSESMGRAGTGAQYVAFRRFKS